MLGALQAGLLHFVKIALRVCENGLAVIKYKSIPVVVSFFRIKLTNGFVVIVRMVFGPEWAGSTFNCRAEAP